MKPVEFVATIKKVTSSIDVVGDKTASMVLEFYATDENLDAINRLQKPDTNVIVTMTTESNGKRKNR